MVKGEQPDGSVSGYLIKETWQMKECTKGKLNFKIICQKCNHVFTADDADHLWCYQTDEPWVKDLGITIQCPKCYLEKEY
jgi:rubredoxin